MQFLFYCLCGGIGVVADYIVYYTALSSGVWYQLANVFGYFSGTLVSFFLNRKLTFDIHDQVLRRLMVFFGVAAIGFSASALLLWLLVEAISVDARVAKLLTLPLVVALQFSLNRSITFREKSFQQWK